MPRDWNHLPDPTPGATACPDCGAPIPGGLGACRALFHTGSFPPAPSMGIGRLMGDCYALQHLEPYCRTAKELIYHLASLCCGLEYGGNPAVYRALQRSIDGKVSEERPEPPARLGDLTILHLVEAGDSQEYAQRVTEWAHAVWAAYADHQERARQWVRRALGD